MHCGSAHLHAGPIVVAEGRLGKVRHRVAVQVWREVADAQAAAGERRPRGAVHRRQRLHLRGKGGAPVGVRGAHVRLLARVDVVEREEPVLEGVGGGRAEVHALLVALYRLQRGEGGPLGTVLGHSQQPQLHKARFVPLVRQTRHTKTRCAVCACVNSAMAPAGKAFTPQT